MTRPDDISQEAWDSASALVFVEAAPLVSIPCSGPDHFQMINDPQTAVACAIMAATLAEREACAKVADEYVWDEHALAQATEIGNAVHYQSVEIAAAIRKRGEA